MNERFILATDRINEIINEERADCFSPFFSVVAKWITDAFAYREFCKSAGYLKERTKETDADSKPDLKALCAKQKEFYKDVLPENYESSYLNPEYASSCFGREYGLCLSFLYEEVRSMLPFLFEDKTEEVLIRLELFLEVYTAFECGFEADKKAPEAESIRQILYWYVSDYSEFSAVNYMKEQYCPEEELALSVMKEYDLTSPEYLFRFGEYVSDTEIETARYLAGLPEETIEKMADTYTEGFRKGFEAAGKDLTIKETVNIRYQLGFERVIIRSAENFEKMGLHPIIYRAYPDIFRKSGLHKIGFMSTSPNRQKDFDHREDMGLFLDGHLVTRKLEALRAALENCKKEMRLMSGPACMETFGEAQFTPKEKEDTARFDEKAGKLWVDYRTKAAEEAKDYLHREERSFTIIAFPVPEIGENFEAVFDEVIRINTLDYRLYQEIQTKIIDALNLADYVHVLGAAGNETDIRVNLCKLNNPEKETIFENCVADVNIPVGEVFTSPVLEGTEGLLHVKKVYINGLAYEDLKIEFKDGVTGKYSCGNMPDSVMMENILYHHDYLPLGEFAIGTNTTAYAAARKFGIEDKFPILIAEKTGPHFAVGDTCYSHEEDVRVFNPDGREIVAKENTFSRKRFSNPLEAYFGCHTDITIPYEEIGLIEAVCKDGTTIAVIKDGRFVLPGTEKLNEALDS